MNHDLAAPEVRSYLAAIQARLAQLPAEQSEEILFGVREHIAEALERGGQSTAEILAGLGSPDDIAAGLAGSDMDGSGAHDFAKPFPSAQFPPGAPQKQLPAHRYQSSTLWVVATAILLPFGAFLAGIGWLFGVGGLWMGTRWKTWEKVVGTVVLPGGLFGSMYLLVTGVWESSGSASGVSVTSTDGNTPPTFDSVEPVVPMLPTVAAIIVILLPIAVAVYLLVVGLRRGTRQA